MQPPPRKSNYAKFLKNLHSEQISKLLAKNQHECDLLEDIRQYTIKRSAIEKSYSEALLKISSGYLNKKIPNIPDIKVDGAEEKWNMWNVWRTVLEENEKLARARLAAVEVFQQQIADEAKVLRQHKVNVSKKCIDQLALTHKELQLCVQEVDKNKKLYFDEEHSAHDVRDKAKDIEEKLKRKKGSFFQSITSLQKNSAKVSSRRDALEEKSSGARNDYLLSLAAANAHQNRYFLVDLQQCMQQMEAHVYERVAEHLTLMGRTELLTCSATQHSFGKIRDQAQQLTRDYNLQCCYLYYPVLKQHIQYEFEACDNDPVDTVTIEHESAAATLSSEVRRWVTRVARENNAIRESTRKLQVYQALRDSGQKTDPNDPNGPDLDTRIDELKSSIRRSETAKLKYEARVECLRVGGAPVDEWLKELDSLAVQDAMPRSSSMTSVRTDVSGNVEQSSDSFYDSDTEGADGRSESRARADTASSGAAPAEDDDDDDDVDAVIETETRRIEQLTAGWDDPTQVSWGEEAGEASGAAASAADDQEGTAFKCTALYSYTAQNPDELSIIENEQLEVVGEGDGDGWLRARNYRGEEGFVPQNYLDVEREEPASANPGLVNQISFSSVDYTVEGEDADLVQSPDQISVISAPVVKKEVIETATAIETNVKAPVTESVTEPPGPAVAAEYCFAMYDYDSDAPDELVLEEGQIIRILDKCIHGVDDGWWRGESNGVTGNFPSVIVELCDEDGEPLSGCEDEEDWTPASEQAVFTSSPASPARIEDARSQPEVADVSDIIINENNNGKCIAPPMEAPPPPPFVEEDEEDEDDAGSYFNLELSRNQQHHYGTQFSQPGGPEVIIVVDEVLADPMDDEDAEETSIVEKVVPPPSPKNNGKNKSQNKAESSDLGLGVAQIVITAATPMTEEPEQPFPPAEEALEKHDALDDANQQMDDNDNDMDNEESSLSEQTAVAVKPHVLDEADDQPTDSAPFPTSSSTASEAESTGPSTADEIGGSGPSTAPQSPPKQVQGGRASIPDELEPHQLARLQDLKESNA